MKVPFWRYLLPSFLSAQTCELWNFNLEAQAVWWDEWVSLVLEGAEGWWCPWTTSGELLGPTTAYCYLANPTQDTTISHLVLHFNFYQSPQDHPFSCHYPWLLCSFATGFAFFFFFCDWLILVLKNSLGLFCIFSQQEKLAGLHYIFMLLHFPKALRLNMNPKSLLIIHTSYVLGAAAIIHTDMGYNASVPS